MKPRTYMHAGWRVLLLTLLLPAQLGYSTYSPEMYSAQVGLSALYSGDRHLSARDQMVWICTGKSAARYHRKADCPGLNNCGDRKVKVSLKKAERMGRTPCKRCYKAKSRR